MDAIVAIVGYELPEDLEGILSGPRRTCFILSKDRSRASGGEAQKWSKVGEHLNDVHQSLSAMQYHLGNVLRMEGQLDLIVRKYTERIPLVRNGNWNPTVTNRLTFEYHAFAFAAVRCLNHLSFTVGRIFNKTSPTLLSVAKVLDAKSNTGDRGAAVLVQVFRTHEPLLTQMFSDGVRRSFRDHIAHESFLPAGSLKITRGNASLFGVLASGSPSPDARTEYRLSDVMKKQRAKVEAFLREVLGALEKHCLPRIPYP